MINVWSWPTSTSSVSLKIYKVASVNSKVNSDINKQMNEHSISQTTNWTQMEECNYWLCAEGETKTFNFIS